MYFKSEDSSIIPVVIDQEEVRLQFFIVDLNSDGTPVPPGDAYIMVYDITDRSSFNVMRNALKYTNDIPTIVVGNKVDLVRKRSVSRKDGLLLSAQNKVKFVEISAALNERIDDLLAGCIRQIQLDRTGFRDMKKITGKWCLPRLFTKNKFNPENLAT
ncbi:hypothetical protein GJ496_009042 [Pomphorhynchus laevis]|nr:hypothetical protein GJ496_009042 [Pomphorhynchus laevis]